VTTPAAPGTASALPSTAEGAPIRTMHVNTERTWRGGERQTLLLATGLRDRGHVVEIVCPPGAPLGERARAAGLLVHDLRMRGELDPVAIARLRRLYREREIDVVQLHTSHAHTLGVLARTGRRRPRTVVARRVDYSIHRSGTPGFTHLKYRIGVDRDIALSEAIRGVLIRDGIRASRVSVVHSGVIPLPPARRSRAEVREELGIPAGARVIGSVAHLALHKGEIHLLRAFVELAGRYPDLHLVIVGDGEERPGIEAESRENGLERRAHFAGFQEDVAAHLSAFDLFIMPSLQEGLCTSLLDALAAGLPIIGSDTGGIPEIIEDGVTGLLAPPGNPRGLAATISRLLDDPARALGLLAAGREKLARFGADAMVDGTIAVYRELLAAAQRRSVARRDERIEEKAR
jgi:glycosyltransferase involved in cell wall biosynthesis